MALCDHKVVGVIVEGDFDGFAGPPGHFLMSKRVKPPIGISPVAGHVDDFGGFEDALVEETKEEAGLDIANYSLVTGGWRDNVCSRQPSGPRLGHDWKVYWARAYGNAQGAPAENEDLRWYSRDEIAALAARTMRYALGDITDAEFKAEPGLEPVWVQWLVDAHLLKPEGLHLELIDALTYVNPTAGGVS